MDKEKTSNKDAEDNKIVAALAYLVFFIPLLAAKESKFAKFHANQGLNLLLLTLAVSVIGGIIPFLGWFLIIPLGGIFSFVLFVMGVMNAFGGKETKLPVIGNIQILK
jgi:uncharacterized membrane protein